MLTRVARCPLNLAVAAVLLSAVAGCGSDPASAKAGAIPEDTFVGAYVSLRIAAWEAADEAEFQERRSEILARYRIEAEALSHFLEVHMNDVPYLARVWRRVEDELQQALEERFPEPEAGEPGAPDHGPALERPPSQPEPASPPPERRPVPPATPAGSPGPDPSL